MRTAVVNLPGLVFQPFEQPLAVGDLECGPGHLAVAAGLKRKPGIGVWHHEFFIADGLNGQRVWQERKLDFQMILDA
jgi:hypothetical protein